MSEKKLTEQDELLEIQMKHKKESRIIDIVTIVCMLVIIYGLSLGTLILPDKEFSEAENRALQQKPRLSTEMEGSIVERIAAGKFLDRLIDGRFTSEISKYFSDQIPARDVFVGIKGVSEIALFKMQNNDVMLGKDGYIIERNDYPDLENLHKNLSAITAFSDYVKSELNIPVKVAVAGRGMDTLTSYTPALYDSTFSDRIWDELIAESAGVDFINLREPLKEMADNGEYVYYKTDHHWTTKGAYNAYKIIVEQFGITPTEGNKFRVETASESFLGTTWSSAGMKWVKPDTIEYYRYDGDENFVTHIIDTDKSFDLFYDRSYLDVKDKYSSFIGGNNAHVTVTAKNQPSDAPRQKLLLIKDSFGHSLVPFLAQHFDLDIIDLRYFKESMSKYISENPDIDGVLFLYNLDSLTSAATMNILNAGIK